MDRAEYVRCIEQSVESKRAVCISRKEALYLHSFGTRGAKAFAKQFRLVWFEIPEGDRRAMLDYWAQKCSTGAPHLEFSELWQPSGPDVNATTSEQGRKMKFNPKHLRGRTDQNVPYTIAHELAHVYQWASGIRVEVQHDGTASYWDVNGKLIGGVAEAEQRADVVARRWGFVSDLHEQLKLRVARQINTRRD